VVVPVPGGDPAAVPAARATAAAALDRLSAEIAPLLSG
jgi:hypothetical protein